MRRRTLQEHSELGIIEFYSKLFLKTPQFFQLQESIKNVNFKLSSRGCSNSYTAEIYKYWIKF